MNTTSKTVQAEADEYASAYADDKGPEWKPCPGCKTPMYCSNHGCQAQKTQELKRAEGK